MRYFFYGTLMDRTVLAAVLGRLPSGPPRPASLDGYRRVFRAGASYPVLVPVAGETVEGVVVDGLGERDAQRLEVFESSDYTLRVMPVRLSHGRSVAARVFMAKATAKASSQAWSLEDWRRRYRRQYLQRVRRLHKPG